MRRYLTDIIQPRDRLALSSSSLTSRKRLVITIKISQNQTRNRRTGKGRIELISVQTKILLQSRDSVRMIGQNSGILAAECAPGITDVGSVYVAGKPELNETSDVPVEESGGKTYQRKGRQDVNV